MRGPHNIWRLIRTGATFERTGAMHVILDKLDINDMLDIFDILDALIIDILTKLDKLDIKPE